MQFIEYCIKRPLVIFILAIALFLAGAFSLRYLNRELVPLPSANNIHIVIDNPGASPSAIQTEITSKVVTALQSVQNIREIDGESHAGESEIDIELVPLSKLEVLQTFSAVNQAVSSVSLPSGASQPTTSISSGSNGLVSFYLYTDDKDPEASMRLLDYYHSHLQMQLRGMPGVSRIKVYSDVSTPIVRISLNPQKLQQYGLSVLDVQKTLSALNQSLPVGKVLTGNNAYLLTINAQTTSIPAIENIIVSQPQQAVSNQTIVRLKDIADVNYQDLEITASQHSFLNGKKALSVHLETTGTADPVTVSDKVVDVLHNALLPPGMHIQIAVNNGSLIRLAITEVVITIILTSILVLLICLAFLGRFRNTLIPIVTIPICLSGALLFLLILGFTLNMFTLLAMVVAIGLVVDDAIVVVEHITVFLEKGCGIKEAVMKGSREIALTIVGITITLVAVYIPTLFMSGVYALWYQQFTVTLSICVLISGVLALTLSPLMSYYLLAGEKQNRYQLALHGFLDKTVSQYQKLLLGVIRHKIISTIVVVALIVLGIIGCLQLPKSILSKDPSTFVTVTVQPGANDTVKTLEERTRKAFANFMPNDKRRMVTYVAGKRDTDTGQLSGQYVTQYDRRYVKDIPNIADAANQYIKEHTTLNAVATAEQFFGFGNHGDIGLNIEGKTTAVAIDKASKIVAALKHNSMILSAKVNTAPIEPQYDVKIDAVKALQQGISIIDLRELLSVYLGGYKLDNNIMIQGESTPIYLQLNPALMHSVDNLQLLTISNDRGDVFPVSDFVSLKLVPQPTVIATTNNIPSVEVDINLAKGYSISDALPLVQQTIKAVAPGVNYQYFDNVREYFENNRDSLSAFLMGILMVYLVLALLFNSLLDPFIILFTVPFSLIGGALSLFLISGSLNIVSSIALITLVGLITKHGVLVVQFANIEMRKGKSLYDAVLSSTAHRFRPIMMTTLAMMAGALPLIFSQGMGYVMRMQLGIVLFFGLLVGTLFSLFIVPLVYLELKKLAGYR